jgi:hypothetical protein
MDLRLFPVEVLDETSREIQRQLSWLHDDICALPVRSFVFPGVGNISILQEPSVMNGRVWDAAVVLSFYLCGLDVDLCGKSVIELGAGTGLAGIVAARKGASVTLTELSEALPLIELNMARNDVQASALELVWTPTFERPASLESADFVCCFAYCFIIPGFHTFVCLLLRVRCLFSDHSK